MNGLEEYTDYVYRVDITDGNNNTIGTKSTVKTYCSGTGLECDGLGNCSICGGAGALPSNRFYYYDNYAAANLHGVNGLSYKTYRGEPQVTWGTEKCKHCGKTGDTKCWNEKVHCSTCGAVILEFKECASCCDMTWRKIIANTHMCHACNSSGKTAGCRHQCKSPHQYCAHEKTSKHD